VVKSRHNFGDSARETRSRSLVQAIPATSPAHQQATAKITQWRKNWQVAEAHFSTKSALDQGNWQVAIELTKFQIFLWKDKVKSAVQSAQSQIAKAKQKRKHKQGFVHLRNRNQLVVPLSPPQLFISQRSGAPNQGGRLLPVTQLLLPIRREGS